jgi:hypothetical protein
MKERIKAIEVNLRFLLNRVEELKLNVPDYQVNALLQKLQLKIDEVSDLLSELEEMGE